MKSDGLFNEAADILENGGEIPTKTSNRLLAAMLKQTHTEAQSAKLLAQDANTLAETNAIRFEGLEEKLKVRFEGLEDKLKVRFGVLGTLSALGGGITSAIILFFARE